MKHKECHNIADNKCYHIYEVYYVYDNEVYYHDVHDTYKEY